MKNISNYQNVCCNEFEEVKFLISKGLRGTSEVKDPIFH